MRNRLEDIAYLLSDFFLFYLLEDEPEVKTNKVVRRNGRKFVNLNEPIIIGLQNDPMSMESSENQSGNKEMYFWKRPFISVENWRLFELFVSGGL